MILHGQQWSAMSVWKQDPFKQDTFRIIPTPSKQATDTEKCLEVFDWKLSLEKRSYINFMNDDSIDQTKNSYPGTRSVLRSLQPDAISTEVIKQLKTILSTSEADSIRYLPLWTRRDNYVVVLNSSTTSTRKLDSSHFPTTLLLEWSALILSQLRATLTSDV